MEENSFMASQDMDKAATGMLRKSLRDSGDACPEPEILAAYFERSLSPDETARCELHFSQCARCREQLAAMDRAGELVAASGGKQKQAARWLWLWDWRWLAPAAAVLVLATIWIARRPAPNRLAVQSAQAPLVAMSQPSALPANAPVLEAPPATPKIASRVDEEDHSEKMRRETPAKSAALADKEKFTANLPEASRNEVQKETQSDTLAKDASEQRRDSNALADGAMAQAAAPPAGTPVSQAPAPALIAPAARQSNSGAVSASSAAAEATPPKQMAASEFRGTTQMNQKAALKTANVRSEPVLIRAPDPQVLWRISGGTFVERSINGGATWKTAVVIVDGNFNGGAAPSTQICWLVGHAGLIYMTADADHWNTIPPPTGMDLAGITAKDALSATVTAADGRKFTTTDAGSHWAPAQ